MNFFHHLLETTPLWAFLVVSGTVFLIAGFFVARKIWGHNTKRLEKALDDGAYLASQWSSLGATQSRIVEKLDRRLREDRAEWATKARIWGETMQAREEEVNALRRQIEKMEKAGGTMSPRELEAYQVQVLEIQKRDTRIQTLETRLHQVNDQNAELILEHKKQTQALLDRIDMLQAKSGQAPDPAIEENNRQLTELLRKRCAELENLRDEFFSKEGDLLRLREQNRELKKSVEDLVEKWAAKKKTDTRVAKIKEQLAKALADLAFLREAYQRKVRELENKEKLLDLAAESGTRDETVAKLEEELKGAWSELEEALTRSREVKSQLDEQNLALDRLTHELNEQRTKARDQNGSREDQARLREELANADKQISALLDEIEARDSQIEELEARSSPESEKREAQIQALSQTIADLQNKATEGELRLSGTREETVQLRHDLERVVEQYREQVRRRDDAIEVLRRHVSKGSLDPVELPDLDGESGLSGNRLEQEVSFEDRRGTPPQHGEVTRSVYFEPKSAYLRSEDQETIREIAREAEARAGDINLIGFASDEGNPDFNEKLSLRRASAVREALEDAGIGGARVVAQGRGRDEALTGDESDWKARRVEIAILPRATAETVN